MTFDQVEARKERGVEGLRRLGEPEKADNLDDESVEDFAERKNITIVNPRSTRPLTGGKRKTRAEKSLAEYIKVLRTKHGASWALKVTNDEARKHETLVDAVKSQRAAERKKNPQRRASNSRRRRNSDDQAAATRKFQEFHGRRPETVKDIEVRQSDRRNLAGLGVLMYLQLAEGLPIRFAPQEKVILACDPQGNQLYFVGGNQDLSEILKKAGFDQSKDLVDVGECRYVIYTTDKDFDNFEEKDYQHEFGEESGERPRLMFDRLNKQMYLIGGAYQVKREGIVN